MPAAPALVGKALVKFNAALQGVYVLTRILWTFILVQDPLTVSEQGRRNQAST